MYVRKFDGKVNSFGVSGNLWRDSLIMYDRDSQSYWSHISGKAIKGKYKGTQLKPLPVQHLKWSEWKKLHPNSKVLVKSRFTSESSYVSYNKSRDRLGIVGTVNFDRRLEGKDIVLGVLVDDIPVVFPHKYFTNTNHVNYDLVESKLLVVYSSDGKTATAFDRNLNGKLLNFEVAESPDGHFIQDIETGSIWDGLSGEAVKGQLKGERLSPIVGTQAFWFGWRGFHPRTVIWNPSG